MSSFDEELTRRLGAREEADARRGAEAQRQSEELTSSADYQWQGTLAVRQWAVGKLTESAAQPDVLIDDSDISIPWHRKLWRSNEWTENVNYYERLKQRKGRRLRGWPIKSKGKYSFEFGQDEQQLIYLLDDARIAVVFKDHGRMELRIVNDAQQWRQWLTRDESFFNINEEDFISAVERKLHSSG